MNLEENLLLNRVKLLREYIQEYLLQSKSLLVK